jgi:hypothetical protein
MSDSYKELRLMVNQISLAVVDLVRENGVIKGRVILLLAEIARSKAVSVESGHSIKKK